METTYRVLRIDEQMYGCEELPAGQPVLCDVTLADPAGNTHILPYPDKELTALASTRAVALVNCPAGLFHTAAPSPGAARQLRAISDRGSLSKA